MTVIHFLLVVFFFVEFIFSSLRVREIRSGETLVMEKKPVAAMQTKKKKTEKLAVCNSGVSSIFRAILISGGAD